VTTEDIYLAIISKPNCSINKSAVGFIQDLHKYAKNTVTIISSIDNPRESIKALLLKEQMLGLLENYDRLNRGVTNAKKR